MVVPSLQFPVPEPVPRRLPELMRRLQLFRDRWHPRATSQDRQDPSPPHPMRLPPHRPQHRRTAVITIKNSFTRPPLLSTASEIDAKLRDLK